MSEVGGQTLHIANNNFSEPSVYRQTITSTIVVRYSQA